MPGFLQNIVDITPSSVGSFVDVDLSAYLPSNAAGALFLSRTPGGTSPVVGWRKKGSTDTWTITASAGPKVFSFAVGVDASRNCQISTSTTACKFYLAGWLTTDDAVFFTNAVDKTPGVTGSWQNVDISGDSGTDTAIGALLSFAMTSSIATGARMNGSTDARTQIMQGGGAIIGVDSSEICQVNISTGTTIYLQGYVKANAVFHTNATDVSLSSTGSYINLPALGAGAIGGIYEIVSTAAAQHFWLREKGSTDDFSTSSAPNTRHSWFAVGGDSSQLVEGRVDSTAVDFFEVGYFQFDGKVKLLSVTSTGAASAFVVTAQRTVIDAAAIGSIGSLTPTLPIAFAGIQAAASAGALTPRLLANILGVSATGAVGPLLADTAQRINLAGAAGTVAIGQILAELSFLLWGGRADAVAGMPSAELLAFLGGADGVGAAGLCHITDGWERPAPARGIWAATAPGSSIWAPVSQAGATWTKLN